MKNLSKKIVFITGASSGFGKAIAYKMADRGCNLIITARRLDRLIETAKDLTSKYPVEVLPLKLDVRSHEEVKNLVSSLPANWKKIEILINNAGLSRGLNKIQDGVLEDWDEMV
ncbi:MAG TPA: SDR family NAD(P)-dependent oxidoreductase, partial [Ignavibacteria bacterium]|nr:SDR family NAD(P)-dependent oxidoreductase [Ignavibacteria bacterium]